MQPYGRLNWRLVLGLWTCVGVLLVLQFYFSRDTPPFSRTGWHLFVCAGQLIRAWTWAALTPAIFQLRREIGRRHPNVVVAGGLHLLTAFVLLAWVNLVRVWTLELAFGYWQLENFSLAHVVGQIGPFSAVDFYFYWIVLATGYGFDLWQTQRQNLLREEQLRTALAQAELAALKQQVQPHFLFNSLNAISALMREGERDRAVEALAQLCQLLRQLMACAGRPEIELGREFDYAQCYLAIEKVRFEEKLVTRFEADEDCLGALVPTLILQPLVENAVKHGISQRRNPGRVTVSARQAGDRLRLQVANDPAEGGRLASEAENHGIGLHATRTRLERVFGGAQRLECNFNGPEGTVVTVELPLRFAAARAPGF